MYGPVFVPKVNALDHIIPTTFSFFVLKFIKIRGHMDKIFVHFEICEREIVLDGSKQITYCSDMCGKN